MEANARTSQLQQKEMTIKRSNLTKHQLYIL